MAKTPAMIRDPGGAAPTRNDPASPAAERRRNSDSSSGEPARRHAPAARAARSTKQLRQPFSVPSRAASGVRNAHGHRSSALERRTDICIGEARAWIHLTEERNTNRESLRE